MTAPDGMNDDLCGRIKWVKLGRNSVAFAVQTEQKPNICVAAGLCANFANANVEQ